MTNEELQKGTGQFWLEIVAREQAASAALAAMTADRDACKALANERLAVLQKADAILTDGKDIEEVRNFLRPFLDPVIADEVTRAIAELRQMEADIRSEADKRIAEIEEKIKSIQGK